MSNFINGLQYACDSYLQHLREENRRRSMSPKEYGMMLKKKQKKVKGGDRMSKAGVAKSATAENRR